ncbi:MAG: ECF transporter S component [Oscillospiraceae bacterium]|nr:ECF transporter S component [Oscillospiraceae bacterium]
MKLEKTLKLTYTAMLTAMVCVATMLIRIPTMVGYTNLGDGFILLSAFLFGPFYGAVAGGIGSMLADILSGYAFYAPATLVIKGLIAVIAALLWKAMRKRGGDKVWKKILASLVAEIWMAAGYWTFETLFLGEAKAALASVPNNIAQGLVGVVLGMVLYYALSKLPMWKKVQLYA